MATIKVDFSKTVGKMKPLHGVGQPPILGLDFSMFHYLKEAGIPYSRLHDVGGWFGGNMFVDIPNLFRDFDASPYEPASYDFTFTDMLITALVENGVEPYFRLGVTIENFADIKKYRIFPPKDFKKWAVICEHVIRHYTEGWADGFHYEINFWEIWNEPENDGDVNVNRMWCGTKEEYYEFYNIASKHLKKCFPHLKIGGYASCGFYDLLGKMGQNTGSNARYEYLMEFFNGFMDYIVANKCPLDFFSWHDYDQIEPTFIYADFVRKRLDEAGYTHTISSCNEWCANLEDTGTVKHASYITGMILAMQNMPVDNAMLYDARCKAGMYSVLFNCLTYQPYAAYYGLKAFNELYRRKNQVALECDAGQVYAVAAQDNGDGYVVICNTLQEEIPLVLEMDKEAKQCYIIDEEHMMTECELPAVLKANDILCIKVK